MAKDEKLIRKAIKCAKDYGIIQFTCPNDRKHTATAFRSVQGVVQAECKECNITIIRALP